MFDVERLEQLVLELVTRYEELRGERAGLLRELAESRRRVAVLETELRHGNQLQSDVAKRIDDLVGQIDQIEARFAMRGA